MSTFDDMYEMSLFDDIVRNVIEQRQGRWVFGGRGRGNIGSVAEL